MKKILNILGLLFFTSLTFALSNNTEQQIEKFNTMLSLVDHAYGIMIDNLQSSENSMANLRRAVDCEIEINEMRNSLREAEILKIEQNDAEYQSSVYYLDLISEALQSK